LEKTQAIQIHFKIDTFQVSLHKIQNIMFIVIACMLAGIFLGYVLRNRKLIFIHRFIITLIWLLLFLLGLEVGSNENVIRRFGSLGFQAFLLAAAATFGSVVFAWLLGLTVRNKPSGK